MVDNEPPIVPSVLHTDEQIAGGKVGTCPVGSGNKLICGGATDPDTGDEWIMVGIGGDATGSGMSAVIQLPKALGSGVYKCAETNGKDTRGQSCGRGTGSSTSTLPEMSGTNRE